jgi:hypothetical protein
VDEFEAGALVVAEDGPAWRSPEHFPGQKYIKRCIEILPLGDATVSSPELFCLSEEKSNGKGVERHSND